MPEHSDVWRESMTAFLCHCRASGASEQADRLLEAMRIRCVQEASADFMHTVPDAPKVDQLLAQSAFECAALEVLGPQTEFELSCGKMRTSSARVRLTGQAQFSSGEGRTIALALLAAWASAHLAAMPRMLVTSEAGDPDTV